MKRRSRWRRTKCAKVREGVIQSLRCNWPFRYLKTRLGLGRVLGVGLRMIIRVVVRMRKVVMMLRIRVRGRMWEGRREKDGS